MNPRKCILETIVCNVETIVTEAQDGRLVYLDRVKGNRTFNIKQTGKLCRHKLDGFTLRYKGELYLCSGTVERVTLEPVASYRLPFSCSAFELKMKLESNSWRIVYGPGDPRRAKVAKVKSPKAAKPKAEAKAAKPKPVKVHRLTKAEAEAQKLVRVRNLARAGQIAPAEAERLLRAK